MTEPINTQSNLASYAREPIAGLPEKWEDWTWDELKVIHARWRQEKSILRGP